jgi:hypothetical protein
MRALALVVAAALFTGCKGSTEFGECIGAFDEKDPGLTYKVSVWNATMGVLFVELIIPPIYVIADATLCPVARKPVPPVTP